MARGRVEATVVDLRYRMNDVLKALERNEIVSVLYRGKVKGILRPAVRVSAPKVCAPKHFNPIRELRTKIFKP